MPFGSGESWSQQCRLSCHSSVILLTSCSIFRFTPPLLKSDCELHPSHLVSWSIPCQINCLCSALTPTPDGLDHARRSLRMWGVSPHAVQTDGTIQVPKVSGRRCRGNRVAADLGYQSDLVDMEPDLILPPSCFLRAASWQVAERVLEARQSAPDPPNQLFVPEAVRSDVLQWAHASNLTCHPGVNCTLQFLQQQFWLAFLTRDTRDYIVACPVCAWGKSSHQPPAALLLPLEIP